MHRIRQTAGALVAADFAVHDEAPNTQTTMISYEFEVVNPDHCRSAHIVPHHKLNNIFICATPETCLLYTSPSPRDRQKSRMPSSA